MDYVKQCLGMNKFPHYLLFSGILSFSMSEVYANEREDICSRPYSSRREQGKTTRKYLPYGVRIYQSNREGRRIESFNGNIFPQFTTTHPLTARRR